MPYKDKERQRTAQRLHLRAKKAKNPQWHAEMRRKSKEQKKSSREVADSVKRQLGCLTCNEKRPEKLEFHHVLPALKVNTVSEMRSRRRPLLTISLEMLKCVCACTGCHKKLQQASETTLQLLANEDWAMRWTAIQAADFVRSTHPQTKKNELGLIDVILEVVKNYQIYDYEKFRLFMKNLPRKNESTSRGTRAKGKSSAEPGAKPGK